MTGTAGSQNPYEGAYKLDGYEVEFSGVKTPYVVASLFALPEKEISIKVHGNTEGKDFILFTSAGSSYPVSSNEWVWKLPDSTGHYKLVLVESKTKQKFTLNTFILFPYTEVKGKSINNFMVGNYPDSQEDHYQKPEGFIEITPEMIDVYLSPHFQVRNFLCKQECEYPMYLVLKENLLIKLEKIRERLVEKGFNIQNVAIMSGYRTPYYNDAIGNVKFSRHQFGDAADIYIDNDSNYYMDDLNNDGVSNSKDVEVLYQTILEMTKEEWYKPFVGGLGFYKPNTRRTGFVHVDVRGNPARWGH